MPEIRFVGRELAEIVHLRKSSATSIFIRLKAIRPILHNCSNRRKDRAPTSRSNNLPKCSEFQRERYWGGSKEDANLRA